MIRALQAKFQGKSIIAKQHTMIKISITKSLIILKNKTEIINIKSTYHK